MTRAPAYTHEEGPRMTTTTSRALCAHCEATPRGCESLHTIAGRRCCERCGGDHDHQENR